VEQNLLRGMLLVVVILIFFLYDFRAGLIVAITIPLALLFAFICLDCSASANLLSIGAVDFGILVDGAVVMVENIFRQIAARKGTPLNVMEIIRGRRRRSGSAAVLRRRGDRGGFLPIYVLSGPSGTLFKPMADTMIFALVGSLIVTLTLLPVLCAWFMRNGVRERRNAASKPSNRVYTKGWILPAHPWGRRLAIGLLLAGSLLLVPRIGAEFMPHLDEGALWVRATMPYTISFDESAKITPQDPRHLRSFPEVTTVASELAGPTTAPIRPAFSTSNSTSA
jgi:cobalt-zinc-cadmium resistance protein CzcA